MRVSKKPINVNVTSNVALLRFDFAIVYLCIVHPDPPTYPGSLRRRCVCPNTRQHLSDCGRHAVVTEHLPRRAAPLRLAAINQYSTSNVMIGSNCPVQSPDKFIGYNEPPGQLFRPQIINSDIFHMMFAEY